MNGYTMFLFFFPLGAGWETGDMDLKSTTSCKYKVKNYAVLTLFQSVREIIIRTVLIFVSKFEQNIIIRTKKAAEENLKKKTTNKTKTIT